LFGFDGQMRVDAGSDRRAMAQPLLNQPQVDAGFQQMRGPTAGSPRGQPAWGASCGATYARKRVC
jgi:hypothetical protein